MMQSTATLPVPHTAGLELAATRSPAAVLELFLAVRVNSANTRRAYRRSIEKALHAIGKPTIAAVTGLDLARYRAALLADARSPNTHALEIAALRSFMLWARKVHVGASQLMAEVIQDALEMPRATVRRPYEIATDPEIRALFDAADDPRDRALLGVLAGAGLRVSEAVGLDVGDVRELPEGGALLRVRHGKGGKSRSAPASEGALRLLRSYLAASGRSLRDEGALFLANDRGARKRGVDRMSSRSARAVVARTRKSAGIVGKAISPHSLRHGFATRWIRAGSDVVGLRRALGHASLATTMIYADHVADEELVASVPELPIGGFRDASGKSTR